MAHRGEDNKAFEQVLEVLIENGLDGMARAMEVLFNEAMKAERSAFLGGECLGCPPNDINGVQTYGTSFDLPIEGAWVTAPGFDSEAAYMTLLGCPDNPGYHLLLSFEPQDGGTVILDQPIFLAEFNAWISDPVPDGCIQPSSYLMPMSSQGEWWNYVSLGGAEPPNETEASTWGKVKKIYR